MLIAQLLSSSRKYLICVKKGRHARLELHRDYKHVCVYVGGGGGDAGVVGWGGGGGGVVGEGMVGGGRGDRRETIQIQEGSCVVKLKHSHV